MGQGMPDLIRRQDATNRTLGKFRHKAFDWAEKATCAHLAAFHLRQMGHRPPLVPKFRSALGAVRAMKGLGFETSEQILDSVGTISRIAPAFMMMGDLAVTEGGGDLAGVGAIAVCLGPLRILGWREDHPKMVVLEVTLDQLQAAWRL